MNRHFFSTLFIILLLPFFLYAPQKNARYSIEFRKAELKNVIRMLAEIEGLNIIIPENIDKRVTVSFKSTTVMNSLAAILRSHGLDYMAEANIIQIATREELQKIGRDLRTRTFVLKFSTAVDTLEQVKALVSERGSVVADVRTNSITVRDQETNVTNIAVFLQNLDTEDKQVLIESKIIEASVEFIRSLGIQWGVTKIGNKYGVGGISTVGSVTSVDTSAGSAALNLNAAAASPSAGIGLRLGFGSIFTDVQLSAAEERGDISVLSRPSVNTLNNHPASIRSGLTFYVKTSGDVTIGSGEGATGTSTGGSSNLEMIETGIVLSVTPQILIDEYIKLSIEATESTADFSREVDGIPAIIDNTASTTVMLKNGETTVLGGMYSVRKSKNVRGVPILSKIPVLGALFRSKTKQKTKSELLIFIKPTIVNEAITTIPGIEAEKKKERTVKS